MNPAHVSNMKKGDVVISELNNELHHLALLKSDFQKETRVLKALVGILMGYYQTNKLLCPPG